MTLTMRITFLPAFCSWVLAPTGRTFTTTMRREPTLRSTEPTNGSISPAARRRTSSRRSVTSSSKPEEAAMNESIIALLYPLTTLSLPERIGRCCFWSRRVQARRALSKQDEEGRNELCGGVHLRGWGVSSEDDGGGRYPGFSR